MAKYNFPIPLKHQITGHVRGNTIRFESAADVMLVPKPAPAGEWRALLKKPLDFRRGASDRRGPIHFRSLPKVSLPAQRTLPQNGLARTPPMGWGSWMAFRTDVDEREVREIADAMVRSGMRDAGYRYVLIDGGWRGRRDSRGVLHPNSQFPDMKRLADYLHAKGLKLGIYSSPGPGDCAWYEGSYGHETRDAQTWARWGVDYLKYDWCSAFEIWPDSDMQAVYQRMAQALRATGRPIVFSLCQYGLDNVERRGALAGGNLWRTSFDIQDNWRSMLYTILSLERFAAYAGPGHWNDPDNLMVGLGSMNAEEYRTQFSLWAIAAAPLIAENDLRHMNAVTRSIVLDRDVIAVDQDRLGRQGRLVFRSEQIDVWTRPLADRSYAVAFVNLGDATVDFKPEWTTLELIGRFSVRDLWRHVDLGELSTDYTAHIQRHGVVMLKLVPITNMRAR